MRRQTHAIYLLIALFLGGFGFASHAWASLIEMPLGDSKTTHDEAGKVNFGIDYSDVFDRQLSASGSGSRSASRAIGRAHL